MSRLLFAIGVVLSFASFCQELTWESGVLITKDQKVLTGSLVYHAAHDAVLLKHHHKVDLFPSHKIQSLRFYDSKADINRQFISIERSNFFPPHALLEIVLTGTVKIVRRLKGGIDQLGRADDATDFNYYILLEDTIVPLQKFKSTVLPTLLSEPTGEIRSFIERTKIDLNTTVAAFQVIKECNRLTSKPTLVAAIN